MGGNKEVIPTNVRTTSFFFRIFWIEEITESSPYYQNKWWPNTFVSELISETGDILIVASSEQKPLKAIAWQLHRKHSTENTSLWIFTMWTFMGIMNERIKAFCSQSSIQCKSNWPMRRMQAVCQSNSLILQFCSILSSTY